METIEFGVVNDGFDTNKTANIIDQVQRYPDVAVDVANYKENLSVPYHRIEWKNLTYEIKKRNVQFKPPFGLRLVPFKKLILQPQSGCIKSGEMTALMGPSGAGKTTLLNAITGKCDPNYVSGDINFVSTNNGKSLLKMSYVPQEDFLHCDLTIRETLTFAYKFNAINSKENLNGQDIKSRVEKSAHDINLTDALDTQISDCSGGQVKRLSVAVELVSNPNILILDEPTTGLDSMNAVAMVKTIKNLLSQRKYPNNNMEKHCPPAVICAIHQPSIEVFESFDQIYVLANEGKNIFSGHPSKVPYMLTMNDIALTPSANPADFLLMLCQSGMEIKAVNEKVSNSEKETSTTVSAAKEDTKNYYSKSSSLLSTMFVLLHRQLKLLRYNPWPLASRFLFCIFSTIMLKSMYNHDVGSHSGCYTDILGFNDPPSNETVTRKLFSSNLEKFYSESWTKTTYVLDNVGYLLFSSTFIIIVHSFLALAETPGELKIITKEVSNNWYSMNKFLSAKILITFTITIFHVSSFTWFMTYMSAQQLDLERFGLIAASWILLAYISELTGLTIGALFHSNLVIAILVQVYAVFPLILFSGFFVKPISIPDVMEIAMFGSQLKHVFYAMMITVYGKGRCHAINEDDLTFSEYLKFTPVQLIGRTMETNNITHETSKLVSPILGLPDDICLAQVINATRDYLFLGSNDGTFDDETTDYKTTSLEESKIEYFSNELSFPLTMFGINEDDLPLCYYSLLTIFFVYLLACYLSFKRVVKTNF